MASKVFKIALAQMAVGKNKVENIAKAVKIIGDAKKNGSSLVVLPECFNSPYGTKFFKEYAEEVPGGPTSEALSKAAKDNCLFVVGGSIPERSDGRLYNTCTVWDPQGCLVASHRKVHLFDIDIPGGITFKESDVLSPGNKFTVVDIGPCKVGIGICYDVRFQEMAAIYRSKNVDLVLYPGAFNMKTGPLHWELLLRARAVDNQVFVAGVCGSRDPSADYVAWGHTMLVDPWGKVLIQAEDQETVLYADVDLKSCEDIREQIPVSKQRRSDLYEVKSKI
uniref:omega-amidase n=1 Tax=Lygus hesperus TaxID=30085 RepID=A0A0A9X6T8_LYGHE